MVGQPRLAMGRGPDGDRGRRAGRAGRRATSSARSCSPRAWPSGSSASAPATGPRPTSARSSATPRTWPGSDGIFCGGFPHPRGWGAFARYLGYHTRQLGDYTWAEAVTHLATHAARRFRLTDRGLLRPGFVADIAVFDPATVDRPLDLRRRPDPGRRASTTSWSTAPSSSRTASPPAPPPAAPRAGADVRHRESRQPGFLSRSSFVQPNRPSDLRCSRSAPSHP